MQELRKITITIDLDAMEYESADDLLFALENAKVAIEARKESLSRYEARDGIDKLIHRAVLEDVGRAIGTVETINELVIDALSTHAAEEVSGNE